MASPADRGDSLSDQVRVQPDFGPSPHPDGGRSSMCHDGTRVNHLGYGGETVVPHPYFGDLPWISHEIETIGVDGDGYVTVNPNNIVRDPETGWVVSGWYLS